jgi:DNA-binding transcriptional MerR regulator
MQDSPTLTIEDLSQRSGVTVRNIRAYQTSGLLDAPERRGRVGYYREEHAERLELIRDLRTQGFGLDAIRRVIEWSPRASGNGFVEFARSLLEGFAGETPVEISATEIAETWGDELTPEIAARALRTGFWRAQTDGTFEVLSPTLREVGRELADEGVPLEAALTVLESLREHVQAIARAYVDMFVENVSRPLFESGEAEERWRELAAALERMRPLATRSLVAALPIVLQREVDAAVARELGSIRQPPPPAEGNGA